MYQTPTNCPSEFQQLHFQNYMQENALVASLQVDTQTKKTIVASYFSCFWDRFEAPCFLHAPQEAHNFSLGLPEKNTIAGGSF